MAAALASSPPAQAHARARLWPQPAVPAVPTLHVALPNATAMPGNGAGSAAMPAAGQRIKWRPHSMWPCPMRPHSHSRLLVQAQDGGVHLHALQGVALGLLRKLHDAAAREHSDEVATVRINCKPMVCCCTGRPDPQRSNEPQTRGPSESQTRPEPLLRPPPPSFTSLLLWHRCFTLPRSPAAVIDLHQAKRLRLLLRARQRRHGDVGAGGAVGRHKLAVVHAVQVVACGSGAGALRA